VRRAMPWMRYRLAEYYRGRGESENGSSIMEHGVGSAHDSAEMRIARPVSVAHGGLCWALEQAIEGIERPGDTEAMTHHDRLQVPWHAPAPGA